MKNKAAQDIFFRELNKLIELHQENLLENVFADDEPDDDGMVIDPDSPMMLDSCVVVMCFRNLQGYTIAIKEEPFGQNPFLTEGLLSWADD